MDKSIYSLIKKANPKPGFEVTDEDIENLRHSADVILAVLAALGVATVAIVAPNALQAIHKLFLRKSRHLSSKQKETKTLQTFYYLKRSGFIKFRPSKHDFKIWLTEKGKNRLQKISFEALKIAKPPKWDGKWWQVAADIPTKKHRRGADLLRQKLKLMGFYPLQRTLWFYPFDPRKEMQFIIETFGINNFVTVMEINRMDKEDENLMRHHFKKLKVI